MDKERYEFCWIVDFPMYEIGDEIGRAGVLPQPVLHAAAAALAIAGQGRSGANLTPCPSRRMQYDLVCNGVGAQSSGAVRNHDPEIMVKAFQLVAPRRGRT